MRVRALDFLSGALLFPLVQGLLFLITDPIAGIEDAGWFLNSGRGVAAVALVFAMAGAVVGFLRTSVREAAMMASGAVLAMIVTLFTIGPGTIFPIVIVFGTAIIAGATTAGTAAGIETRRALTERAEGRS